jgi:outer membrane protein TolC
MARSLFLSLLLLVSGTTVTRAAEGEEKSPLLTGKPLRIDPKDDELQKLLKERYNAAQAGVEVFLKQYQAGVVDLDHVFEASRRLRVARLELCEKPEEKIACLEELVRFMKSIEQLAEGKSRAGVESNVDVMRARYYRLDVEIELLRAKRAAAKK